jgi:hypothetical protein
MSKFPVSIGHPLGLTIPRGEDVPAFASTAIRAGGLPDHDAPRRRASVRCASASLVPSPASIPRVCLPATMCREWGLVRDRDP